LRSRFPPSAIGTGKDSVEDLPVVLEDRSHQDLHVLELLADVGHASASLVPIMWAPEHHWDPRSAGSPEYL